MSVEDDYFSDALAYFRSKKIPLRLKVIVKIRRVLYRLRKWFALTQKEEE